MKEETLQDRVRRGKVNMFDLMYYAEEHGKKALMDTEVGRAQLENEVYMENQDPHREHTPGQSRWQRWPE